MEIPSNFDQELAEALQKLRASVPGSLFYEQYLRKVQELTGIEYDPTINLEERAKDATPTKEE